MFETSRELLEKYIYLVQEYCSQDCLHILHELRGRLRQLQHSCEVISLLAEKLLPEPSIYNSNGKTNIVKVFLEDGAAEADPTRISTLKHDARDQLIIYLEQFYSSAHRVMDLVNDNLSELKGLKRVKAKGITITRNHLIEHTSKKGGQPVYTFSLSVSGPRLRPISWSKNEASSRDEGLWENAKVFECNLNASIKCAIESFK